jgi:hypothetical protein
MNFRISFEVARASKYLRGVILRTRTVRRSTQANAFLFGYAGNVWFFGARRAWGRRSASSSGFKTGLYIWDHAAAMLVVTLLLSVALRLMQIA